MSLLGKIRYKVTEFYYERKLGIKTSGLVMPDDFGAKGDGCHAYLPLSYLGLKSVFKTFSVKPNEDVIIDYGSGMGRVPLFAATYPFKKIIGVELSGQLNQIAKNNLKHVQDKLVCKDVEFYQGDAREYPVPDDASIIYFFMPFDADILSEVLTKIYQSVVSSPRKLTILYVYPTGGGVTLHQVAPQLSWLKITEEKALSSSLNLMIATI
jgi:16S rRNA G966 N2-methylase RsmD